jgi:diguanylate cyclase (GGDEF)-like protein/PAS domain S-box-containing protein
LGQDNESLWNLVDALRNAHAELRQSHERFERIARTIPCVLYDFSTAPDGTSKFLYLSPRCEEFFEISGESIVEDSNRFWRLMHPDDLARLQQETWKTTLSRDHFETEARVITPSGRTRWIQFSFLPNAPDPGQPIVWSGFMLDVTERKLMEEEVKRLATLDSLTGIANRRRFLEQLEGELERFRRTGAVASFLMIDLDSFKRINDSEGHAVGDVVLKHFADLVRQNLRQLDAFGRIGGEEFAVLLPQTRLAGAIELAARLCQIVASSPAASGERSIAFTASMGVTEFQPGESGPESVMARADAALYRAKQGGRNKVVVY